MSDKDSQQERWILPTMIVLVVLTILYILLLLPPEITSNFSPYFDYFMMVFVLMMTTSLSLVLYQRQQHHQYHRQSSISTKKQKMIEQIIWRNRYVLQFKKHQSMQWSKEKQLFANTAIFTIIPESEYPFQKVSELIEQSLRGGAPGGIKPHLNT